MHPVTVGKTGRPHNSDAREEAPRGFAETRWSKVWLASRGDSASSRQALEELCQTYWHPIYAFLRREGCQPHDAEDLTQQFFCSLLEKRALATVERSRGRFRTFLLKALRNFRIDQARKRHAQKRGGDNLIISLNRQEAEQRYEQEPDPGLTPEQVYDLQWVTTLLDQALRRLRAEFEEAGQSRRFDHFKTFLSSEPDRGAYDHVAQELGMTRRAVTGAIYRMRQRYSQLIRSEVAETVSNPDEVESELRALLK